MVATGVDRIVRIRDTRWNEHNSARQTLVVEAAVALLDETAVGQDVAVEQIAKRAGLARSVLYRQFDGRDDLDRRIRTYIVERSFEVLAANLDFATGSVEDIVSRTVRAMLDWRLAHPRWYEFLGTGPTEYDEPSLDAVEGLRRRFQHLVKVLLVEICDMLGVDFAQFDTLPYATVAMVDGTLTAWIGDPSPARTEDEIVDDIAMYVRYLLFGAARSVGVHVDPAAGLMDVIQEVAERRERGEGDLP
jgi:AcrR family transcriptional regulator